LPEVISNTSPLQYLHQIGLLDLLPLLVGRITVPEAVVEELEAGHALGYDLPDVSSLEWVTVRAPAGLPRVFSPDLGRGETEVLRLALESPAGDVILILDDMKAREAARRFGLKFTGTLGVLLEAKRGGLLTEVRLHLDRLDARGFRVAADTRLVVLRLAGERP
jgi:predicted nucleic acid-binding protein